MAIRRPPLALRALVVILLVTSFWWVQRRARPRDMAPSVARPAPSATELSPRARTPAVPVESNAALLAAAREQRSHVQLFAVGRVARLLPDDNQGSRHQRFLVRISDDLTVLVAYNLDLAPHIPLIAGDSVTLRGEYIWNEKGGLLHWTHHDPAGRHQPGWVDYGGRRYQ